MIDSVKAKKFVEKSSIVLLNIKPSSEDIRNLCLTFSLYDSLEANRKLLIDSLMRCARFSQSIFDQFRFEYLEGIDADQIHEEKTDYKLVLQTINMETSFFDNFNKWNKQVIKLDEAEDNLCKRKMTIAEVQKCFFDNKFYDDANMGSANYVTSTFNYILFRLPTKYELQEARKMVENFHGSLFMTEGNNKEDYLNIMFSSKPYIEGQVRYWYNKILGREPTLTEEILNIDKRREFNIEDLIERVLLSEDFIGRQKQEDVKTKRKSPMSFTGMGFADVHGATMDMHSLRQLERSYSACGDHSVIESLLIRSILNEKLNSNPNDTVGQSNAIDSTFTKAISNCPSFGANRAKDPLLMSLSVLYYYTASSDSIILQGYNHYQDWQKKNAPHSIWGINDPPGISVWR